MTPLLKLAFGLWGLLGICIHLLKKVQEFNNAHPDNRVNTPRQMWLFVTSDTPGLVLSVACYIACWGCWSAFQQISKQITTAQFAWLAEMLMAVGNPWVGIVMVFVGLTSDSTFNKAAAKFTAELDKQLAKP
jgi:hypothetical protein